MDGGNATVPDAEAFLDDLNDGGKAVGRAAGVGYQLQLIPEQAVVAAQDDVEGLRFLDGCRNDDALDAALVEVGTEVGNLEEFARAFHDHFNSHAGPIDLLVVGLLAEGHGLAVDGEGIGTRSARRCDATCRARCRTGRGRRPIRSCTGR